MPTGAESWLPLPKSVKVLGSLYLLAGGLGLIEMIWAAFQGTFYLSAGVIAIPLGVGLLSRGPAWRKLALWAAVVQILVIGLMAYLLCRPEGGFADLSADLSDSVGPLLGVVILGALATLMVAVLAISIWSICLLTRNEVKRVFQPDVNSKRRFGLLRATVLVILLATISRETGGVSLHYFTWSEKEPREEKRESPRFRVVLGDQIAGEEINNLDLAGFQAPCLIEVRGMGEEWYGVASSFKVQRHFDAGGGSTETHREWKSYGGRAVSQIPPSLHNSPDRFVVEVDQPQLTGNYWLPLAKHFTVQYRARIHGEGKYGSYQDEVNEWRDVTVSGLCSVHDLRHHLLMRKKDAALDKITSRAEQTAKHATWLMYQGSKATAAKEYDQAIAIFDKALRLDPKDARALRERGIAWTFKGECDKAIQDYNQVIRLDPKDALAFNNRGRAWYAKKDYERAIKDYNEAIALDPKFTAAEGVGGARVMAKALIFRNRGDAWYAKKDYDKANKDYAEANRLDPKYAKALFIKRGDAWYGKKEYDKAIKEYDEAIRCDPKDGFAFYSRALAWSAKKQYDKAIKDCDEAIRLDSKDGWAHYYRSVAQLLDRRPKPVDGFQAVLNLQGWKGDLSPYAVILGHFAARQAGDEPAAKRFLKDSAGKLDETWPYPVIQFLRGDIDEPALLKLSIDDDKRTEARCFLGMDYAIKGPKGEALAHFRWVKEHGNTRYIEYMIAVAELERLERLAERPKP
jgi:tetratricopeptide (TPR) repeat protein